MEAKTKKNLLLIFLNVILGKIRKTIFIAAINCSLGAARYLSECNSKVHMLWEYAGAITALVMGL